MSKRNQAVQFSTVAKVLLVSLFLGGSGVGYVLQKGQIRSLRMERDELTTKIEHLQDGLRRLDADLETATQRTEIHRGLERHDLQLAPTRWQNVVTLVEPEQARVLNDVRIAKK